MQTNNKLREALVQVQKKINYLIGNLTVPNSLVANRMEINGIINAALAAPPRNCDIPNIDERFDEFCRTQKYCCECKHHAKGSDCKEAWLLDTACESEVVK